MIMRRELYLDTSVITVYHSGIRWYTVITGALKFVAHCGGVENTPTRVDTRCSVSVHTLGESKTHVHVSIHDVL